MIAGDTPRALIAEHVEPEVVEVYGDEAPLGGRAGPRAGGSHEIAGADGVLLREGCRTAAERLKARNGVALTCIGRRT
jgi:hypothetical protein